MRSKRHIHKYYKAPYGVGRFVWACALPDCLHHMPPHMEKMVNGKASICWECNNGMTMNPDNMKLTRPICESCRLGIKTDEKFPELTEKEIAVKSNIEPTLDEDMSSETRKRLEAFIGKG